MTRLPKKDRYRPTSRRQSLVILMLAVAMAVAIWLAVLDPWARLERAHRPRPDRPPCAAGQLVDCAGGKVDVIMVTPPAASMPASSP
jgi:hypothetical protein